MVEGLAGHLLAPLRVAAFQFFEHFHGIVFPVLHGPMSASSATFDCSEDLREKLRLLKSVSGHDTYASTNHLVEAGLVILGQFLG